MNEAAPALDAALVRILKRFHVLTGEEILRKLADYPQSLELPRLHLSASLQRDSGPASQLRMPALQHMEVKWLSTAYALCVCLGLSRSQDVSPQDRGLLRGESQPGPRSDSGLRSAGEFNLQTRFFYEP